MSAEGLTRTLACYAAETRPDALPDAVRHEAARAFLNWTAVAIGGAQEEAVRIAARFVAGKGSGEQASVIGHGFRSDVASAAFVNCIASSVLAYDDAHLPTVAHPSGPAAAALLALAQGRKVSGPEFVTALALGIELQCRIANMLVLPPAPLDTSFYVNGFSGPVGVAAAAGRLLGLDPRRMGWAFGLAASQAGGFRAVHGTMASHFRPGHATRVGLDAALLAERGFDCIDDALEAHGGFLAVFAPGSDPDLALNGLGSRHEMLANRYKPYPCGIVIHPVIDACRELRTQIPDGASISRVRLLVNPLVLTLTGKRTPRTALESHVSAFHWAAVALLEDAPGLAANGDACLADAAVAALRERIEAEADADMGKAQARVQVTLADGTMLETYVEHARGSQMRPMSDAELDAKFQDLAAGSLRPGNAEALREACWGIGDLTDVGAEIGSLLP
jgi:2-methylcitrate dehydratase PrpD